MTHAEMTVEALVSLKPQRGWKVRSPRLRCLLPDPMHSDGWARFSGTDILEMTVEERAAESFVLRVAVAQHDSDQIPPWLLSRIAALDAAA